MKYFDNDLYDLLINQEKNYIFVEIQNKNHDLYKVTIRFIHDFHFQCNCGKMCCFHIQYLCFLLCNKYNKTIHRNYYNFYKEPESFLYIPMEGSKNVTYGVEIKVDSTNSFQYSCTCGLRYRSSKRRKCKHIEGCLDFLQNQYRLLMSMSGIEENQYENLNIII